MAGTKEGTQSGTTAKQWIQQNGLYGRMELKDERKKSVTTIWTRKRGGCICICLESVKRRKESRVKLDAALVHTRLYALLRLVFVNRCSLLFYSL